METFIEIKLVHHICAWDPLQKVVLSDYVTMKKHLRTKGLNVYVNIKGEIYTVE